MPVGVNKIHPFLAAVAAGGTVKEVVRARVRLVEQCNEVVLHGSFLCHKEAELPVHCFELVACFIHASILLQFCPSVKSISCDFFGIRLVRLGRAEGIISEIPDEDRIYGTDKDAGVGKPGGKRLVVSARVFHAGFCLAVKALDLFD